jgi:ankyrin repeat protein
LGECTTIAINEKDATGCTALFRAVSNNHVSIAKLLLTLGASPNEATSDGHTPLHAAAKNGNYEMCKILLQHKANLNALTNVTHSAPLHIAGIFNFYF